MTTIYHRLTPLHTARILQAPDSIAALDLMRGVLIADGPPSPWVLDVEIDGVAPPHILGGTMPLASGQFLNVLLDLGIDNIQIFPTELRCQRGHPWMDHSAFNVIGLVDAADPEAADDGAAAQESGVATPGSGTNLVLSRNAARGLSLFRLFHEPAALIVDDRVMRALNRHRPAEGWGFVAFETEVTAATHGSNQRGT